MKLLIKNGLIVNADKSFKADILCNRGSIIKIADDIPEDDVEKLIDATDRYIFPGGIDPHVHMHLPTPAGFSADDFYSGSKAALMGGTTTLIDFVTPTKEESLPEALQKRKNEALDSLIDYSFHVSPVRWTSTMDEEIKTCIEQEGITSFKIYMAYKKSIGLEDDIIQKVLKSVGKHGGLVSSHCELGDEIDTLRENFITAGKTSAEYHPLSRPDYLEAEAVAHLIDMAKKADCPIYVVHVSTQKSFPYIEQAQNKGQVVFAESCPQYLLLDDSKYQGNFIKTAPYVMSPPLRKKDDNQGLWKALKSGVVQTVGTDHCPFTLKQKENGKDNFTKIANGAGGVEHRMTLLYTYGVLEDRISLNQFVALTSTNAAKIFGLYPKKGVIQEGADADLLIWNPKKEQVISAKTHYSLSDNNIFEGFTTIGSPSFVISKGNVVVKEDTLFEEKCKGKFLKRAKPFIK
jgi:dihydropyrimidinase